MISFEKILCNHHQFTKTDYWYQHVLFFRGRGGGVLLISIIEINRYIICVCLAFFPYLYNKYLFETAACRFYLL